MSVVMENRTGGFGLKTGI